jgi:sensor histidine kinase regulating citrate/malate metabolism
VVLEGFLQDGEYDRLAQYVREFESSIAELQTVVFSRNPVVNVLLRHFAGLAEREGALLTTQLDVAPEIPIPDADLAALLSNLLENALEACHRQESGSRFIELSIGQKPSMLSIHMKNSTDGKLIQRGGEFISSKARGRKGYGLESIRAVADRYGGDAQFLYDEDEKIFSSTVLLTF